MDPHSPKISPANKAREATELMLREPGESHCWGGTFAIRLDNELSGLWTRELLQGRMTTQPPENFSSLVSAQFPSFRSTGLMLVAR